MSLTSAPPTQSPTRLMWWLSGGMLTLAIGYFVWYTPYAALTKALSSGLLPGMDAQVGGMVLLPAAAFGTLVGSAAFLTISGWWRYMGRREVFRRIVRFPSPTMILAGFFMALVIATTTLNYTFAGVSILFMLLMMRGGVLILSPLVDTVRRRRVRVYSWLALTFSLLAVLTALADVNSYTLTMGAVLSLGFYFAGYIGRFQIMSKVAKTGDEQTDRRYFAEEAITAAVWQVVLCGVLALVGPGQIGSAVREGFTTFLLSPAVLPAFGIGLLYSALYVYGTLIYLDPREYTWCVPANRCASLLSGLAASFGLAWLTGIAIPGTGQLIATGFVFLAIAALCYPVLSTAFMRVYARPGPLVLFVCGGNTCRSPMAEAITKAMFSGASTTGRWRVASAGLTADVDAPLPEKVRSTLIELGVPVNGHRARKLTPEMIAEAEVIYCMTDKQREAIIAIAPKAAGKIVRLDPDGDILEPNGQPQSVYRECAERIRYVIPQRLAEFNPKLILELPQHLEATGRG